MDHGEHRVVGRRKAVAECATVVRRDAPLDRCHQKGVDNAAAVVVGFGGRAAEAQGVGITVEQRNMVHPVDGSLQAQGQRRDDAIGAEGMVHLLDIGTLQFNHLRSFFQGDDADHGDIAGVLQYAVAHRARARITAGDEAADGGDVACAGVHQDLLPSCHHRAGAHGPLQVSDQDTGFASHLAWRNVDYPVQPRDVQYHPALHRHTLAVVASAAAANGQFEPVSGTCGRHPQHLGFGAWHHNRLAYPVVQQLGEDRAVPEVVARLGRQHGAVGAAGDWCDVVEKILQWCHGGQIGWLEVRQ